MNPGLAIFKKRQRFQGGTGEVRGKEPPFAEGGKWWWEKADERARELARLKAQRDDEQGHVVDAATDEQRKGVYGTIGINVDGEEHEVPLWHKDMTADEAEDAARMRWEWDLSSFAPDSELEAKQNAAHQGPDDASALPNHYDKGTDEVQARQAVDPSAYQGQKLWDKLIRSFERRPVKQRKGPQFSPHDVPIVPMDEAGNLGYDPELGSSDEYLLAQGGRHTIPWPAQVDELMERLFFREKREPYPKDRNKFNPRDVPLMDTDTGRAFNPESLGNMNWVQKGTSNVPNPGLRLFYQKQKLKKPKI